LSVLSPQLLLLTRLQRREKTQPQHPYRQQVRQEGDWNREGGKEEGKEEGKEGEVGGGRKARKNCTLPHTFTAPSP
jgi:hypothetical protein